MPDSAPHYYFFATRKPDLDQGLTEEEFGLVTVERLGQAGYWDRLYATVLWMDEVHEVGLAQKLAARLERLLQPPDRLTLSPDDEERLRQLILLAKIVALPTLKPRDLEAVCGSGVVLALRAGLNLTEGMMNAFLFFGEPELALPFSLTVTRVLGTNAERVSRQPIVVPGTGERVEPTVANWLRCYNASFPSGAERGPVERAQYLHGDNNVKPLTLAEREILAKLLELYDLLRFPHKAPIEEGSEEPEVERRKAFVAATAPPMEIPSEREKLASTATRPSPSQSEATALQSVLRGFAAFDQTVASAVERISTTAGRDSVKLRGELQGALQRQDSPGTVAALMTMVKSGALPGWLRDDQNFQRETRLALQTHLGPGAVAKFAANPAARQSVQMYLQYVLQERLGLAESEAARVGMQLGNHLRQHGHPELAALAYYDVKNQTFKWLT